VDLSRKRGCVAISLKGMGKKTFFSFNFLSYYSYFYAQAFWDAQNRNTQQINVLASGFVLNV